MRFYLAAGTLLMVVLLQNHINASTSGIVSESSDTSIPILASGKRQHNIMRFGKRPSSGHNLIHFGKRAGEEEDQVQAPTRGHSFLYFGKRSVDQPPTFWDYFHQKNNRDGSYKRGHSIMRFGKRSPPLDRHSFIRFGRGAEDEEDMEKRQGHSMLYFGKRAAGNNGHSMMYFGKRNTGHNMMYFGKRDDEEDFDKRNNGHSMLYFGKRDFEDEDSMDKRAHAMIHFGKRDIDEEKRAHSMIHFGKREDPRRGSHSMIHFGKRDAEDVDEEAIDDASYIMDPEMKRQHNLLRFGKKMDRKGSHAMIHFGKRDDKRAHSMIHFGKRSADEGAVAGNKSDEESSLSRMKREVGQEVSLVRYDEEDEVPFTTDSEISLNQVPGIFGYPFERQEEDWEPNNYVEYQEKKEGGI